MPETTVGTTILDLPVELRLQIASYALDQPRDAGLAWEEKHGDDQKVYSGLVLDANYSAASNLELLLVCRSFHKDFTKLAYQKTTFVLPHDRKRRLDQLPLARLQNIRRLIVPFEQLQELKWQEPSNYHFTGDMALEELSITCHDDCQLKAMVDFLRNVGNIKSIRLLFQDNKSVRRHRKQCYSLAGSILKEDHYQRYDAPDAPNPEASWWSWRYDSDMHIFRLTAQPAKHAMEEKAYMELVAPLIEELIDEWTY